VLVSKKKKDGFSEGFGFEKFWLRKVLASKSFGFEKFWFRKVLGLKSVGFGKF
jgi:hypothetical protein